MLSEGDSQPNVRIEIDLNVSSPEGYARVNRSRVLEPLSVGDRVIVFESEDQVSAPGEVVRIKGSFAYIRVSWEKLAHDPEVKAPSFH
jgi:hypothetical protein